MCSRAGLVVEAQFGDQQSIISICSLVGAPETVLQVLRQISTDKVAIGLQFSPDGLLLAWAECGNTVQPHAAQGRYVIKAKPCLRVCELATGRCAKLGKLPLVVFGWMPIPTAPFAEGRRAAGVFFVWASTGTSLSVSDSYILGEESNCYVRQICLLP